MIKNEKARAQKIFTLLKKEYPDIRSALNFTNAFELLIATILSAQSTDVGINKITPILFKKYKSPKDYVDVPVEELEKDIHSSGFYHAKARSIKNSCAVLVEKYKGKMPKTFEELNALPGVGRKTASVVVGNAYGIPAVAVDTHVKRLSNLLGFIKSEDPDKIEIRLKELLPDKDWVKDSHLLAAHGRKICIARRPKCRECVLGDLCPSFNPG
ncbi:MAG: endonuclease III [Ignavibacteriaceae bacterium]|nr:endonuclease III [Ignavibacteriaceae bacterium]